MFKSKHTNKKDRFGSFQLVKSTFYAPTNPYIHQRADSHGAAAAGAEAAAGAGALSGWAAAGASPSAGAGSAAAGSGMGRPMS